MNSGEFIGNTFENNVAYDLRTDPAPVVTIAARCSESDKMTVNGGFFWQQDEATVTFGYSTQNMIAHCVFHGRPRWWQVIQWFKVFRYVVNLPHSDERMPFVWPFSSQIREIRFRLKRWWLLR